MATKSAIEWTDSTWNPLTGCTKVSPGCRYCYAERMAKRLEAMGQPNYARGFEIAMHEHTLDLPVRWKKPRAIFVNSMSDLFHEAVPFEFIQRIADVMRRAHWHRFQALTKRSERMRRLSHRLPLGPNVWLGVSVETEDFTWRIDDLREARAQVKFVSLEPLLGPIRNLELDGIDWVIAGGESGPKARPVAPAWVASVRDQCLAANVPFFFKQWGGRNRKKAGRRLEGRTWDQLPRPASATL
ncbi:MAG TPA: phage Gp37/Gp68 family protein [Sumerlaeia bacterium]|nr:phage Gp37/Gp68 family protein [Sumerlaeia bacterium]